MATPPGAADAMIEEFRKARLKRRESTHFVNIPRLFTTLWLKQLNKVSDIIIKIPPYFEFWNKEQFEPLYIAIAFPYIPHRPWVLKGSYKMLAMERHLCRVFKTPQVDAGSICMNFLSRRGNWPICGRSWCGSCYSMENNQMFYIMSLKEILNAEEGIDSEDAMRLEESWGEKYVSKDDYLFARPGDHLCIPFECDYCIFIKLRGHLPRDNRETDKLLMKCIRRVNLDAFWSRTTQTIGGLRRQTEMVLKILNLVGLSGPFRHTVENLQSTRKVTVGESNP